jgi:hypothetical protein
LPGPSTTPSAAASIAIAALLRTFLTRCGLTLSRDFFLVVLFLVESVFVFVQLDFVIEVRLLKQFAQVACAEIRGKRLLFIIVEVVFVSLRVEVRRVEFFFFNQLFFNVACTRRIRRNRRNRGSRLGLRFFNRLGRRWLLRLLLAAEAK